jgi:cytidine deaminase
MNEKELINLAKSAAGNAHAPYSGLNIGSVLIADDGNVFAGVNVENSSYGLTICAERNAVAAAVAAGCKSFTKLVIFSSLSPPAVPCGACLQVLLEFNRNLPIVCANDKGEIEHHNLNELLPAGFKLEP